ncbi:MacB family efflux pump subunit [Campylobacter sp. faydin G-24]|uniref:Pyoverdine export ATP-binding/permease protein PvdT n=1 Tax=Campylobacter anatolicus TaxID=2829105 RepID=A0ABS5HI40_9BACT|nr:MacB family efflux pump subunit [Campylobacter anatolicus]
MINLKDIRKNFKVGDSDVEILHGINLEIKKGEFIAIIGQSGSGKSTLMNILGCLDSPSDGRYELDGRDISNLSSDEFAALRREKFGFIFQRYNLLMSMSALENVALPSVYAGINKKDREQKAHQILTSLNLDDKALSLPNKLSGGQQQRVSIARALINGGEIILADEPTGALDSKSGIMVMDILVSLHKQGHTIIVVTHDPKIAEYANRVIEIKDGNIISDTIKSSEIYRLEKQKVVQKSALTYYKDQLIESFKMSISAMLSHKLRSLLTMLGIIIGITSVISVVALGQGSQEQILAGIRKIGTNTIDIMPGKGFGDMRSGRVKTLVISDADMLARQSFLDSVTPNTSTTGTLTFENISLNASLRGGGSGTFDVNGLKLESGRIYDDDEVASSSSVAVIDQNTKKSIFAYKDPIGQIVMFNKRPLRIIGVLQKDDFTFGDASTLKIYIPYTTAINKITGDKHISSITARVKESINAQVAEKSIIELLTIKHGKQDFFTRNSDSVKQTVESTISTMRILISSIAVISLIVGGIGVMNIMLVSVTERTKEIGIKMAIGARSSNILQQFLIEAVLLCVIGGSIGIALSYAIGYGFSNFGGFIMIFSNTSIVIALVTSMMIGIVFGYMPARNASRLDPIEALSRE